MRRGGYLPIRMGCLSASCIGPMSGGLIGGFARKSVQEVGDLFLWTAPFAYIESLRQNCGLFLSEQLVHNVTLNSFTVSADQSEAFEYRCHYLQNRDTLPPLAIIGRASTGKSHVASLLVDKATSLDLTVLIAAPTGFQSESLRAQRGNNEKVSVGTLDSKLRYA